MERRARGSLLPVDSDGHGVGARSSPLTEASKDSLGVEVQGLRRSGVPAVPVDAKDGSQAADGSNIRGRLF